MERLDKFLVSQNIGSRKEAARLVRGGAVTVNGQTAKDPAQKLDPALDRVAVERGGRWPTGSTSTLC